ncbi:hypothetical protein MLD38_011248 [Melastoma candidum]|uniref:Uncharacterized protein n=1 Tax=Melastoma candidum TaxID=119954 RepID=A0ACB9R2Z0_9MYRT|nr:hypothetical protein MLD38_011248 [Melastoma candidum]
MRRASSFRRFHLAAKSNPRPSSPQTHNYPTKLRLAPSDDPAIIKFNMAITAHMRDGRIDSALGVFNSMPRRSVVSYNAVISGYVQNGRFYLARNVFDKMPERDLVSWNLMISGYVRNNDLFAARELFESMPKRDIVSWNAMLSGYAQNGYVDEARKVFDSMPTRNSISWNGILSAYVQNGRLKEARRLFESKEDWELVSWNCLMSGYIRKKRLADARILFNRMAVRDEVSWNCMITGHAQNGEMDEARMFFQEAPNKDVFAWTAMVSGYIQNGMLDEARRVFDEMPEKNAVSWNAMIAGYVQAQRMDMAKELFDMMPCRNIGSWNTMVTGYAQNGNVDQAKILFDCMPQKDCISWAAIISGYAQSGHCEEALHQFIELQRDGGVLNRASFACSFAACADIAALELGRQLHGQSLKAGYESGCFVGNALLAMYCKCGSIEEAYDAFRDIVDKDLVSWNTMITGYSRHGFGNEALAIFDAMQAANVRPDAVTMVGVLSACSHNGLIERGMKYFYSMDQCWGIALNLKHYTCMIDLLGRSGRLNEAVDLMKDMPFEPDAATWGALLGASRVHGNTKLGEKAAEVIFEMQPDNAGMYVLLSNLYATSGRWADVNRMRLKMRDNGVKKVPGYSWIEVQNKVHTFTVDDPFHPEKDRIYAFLEELDPRMKLEGYVSSTKSVLHDVEEEEKEQMLKYHSERLAVAFGILFVPPGRPIRVMKNLRVCSDCHNAIKYISRIADRLIILRDNNRFHHFTGGSCSCGDYW